MSSGRDITQLVSVAQFQQQAKQIGTEAETLLASIPIAVNQKGLAMQAVEAFGFARQVSFEPKGGEALFGPKRRFRRRARRDAQRDDTRSDRRLGAADFPSAKSPRTAFGKDRRDWPCRLEPLELPIMPSLSQAEGVRVCGNLGDVIFGPFKISPSPRRFQLQPG